MFETFEIDKVIFAVVVGRHRRRRHRRCRHRRCRRRLSKRAKMRNKAKSSELTERR